MWEDHEQSPPQWYCKSLIFRRRKATLVTSKDEAVQVLQGFARCICARHRVVILLKSKYFRVFDENLGTYFYYDKIANESTWRKPKLLLMHEPPIFIDNEEDKRNPLLNRLQTTADEEIMTIS